MTRDIESRSQTSGNQETSESKDRRKKYYIMQGIARDYNLEQIDEKSAEAIQRVIANVVELTAQGIKNEESNETILGHVKQHPTYLHELDDQLYIDLIDKVRLAWAAPF